MRKLNNIKNGMILLQVIQFNGKHVDQTDSQMKLHSNWIICVHAGGNICVSFGNCQITSQPYNPNTRTNETTHSHLPKCDWENKQKIETANDSRSWICCFYAPFPNVFLHLFAITDTQRRVWKSEKERESARECEWVHVVHYK